jgi:hypothetical protein
MNAQLELGAIKQAAADEQRKTWHRAIRELFRRELGCDVYRVREQWRYGWVRGARLQHSHAGEDLTLELRR